MARFVGVVDIKNLSGICLLVSPVDVGNPRLLSKFWRLWFESCQLTNLFFRSLTYPNRFQYQKEQGKNKRNTLLNKWFQYDLKVKDASAILLPQNRDLKENSAQIWFIGLRFAILWSSGLWKLFYMIACVLVQNFKILLKLEMHKVLN